MFSIRAAKCASLSPAHGTFQRFRLARQWGKGERDWVPAQCGPEARAPRLCYL